MQSTVFSQSPFNRASGTSGIFKSRRTGGAILKGRDACLRLISPSLSGCLLSSTSPNGPSNPNYSMTEPEQIESVLKEGPVVIQNQGGTKVNSSYALWDGISARELFPPGAETGAFYVLTLAKEVSRAEDVRIAEVELSNALLKIASAWVSGWIAYGYPNPTGS